MNAVNLMPVQARRADRRSLSISPQSLGLFGVLLAVLIGTTLYVSAHDQVSSRRAELNRLTVATQRWSVAAARSAGAVTLLDQRRRAVDEVTGLVADRYDWSRLLSQLAGVLPASADLTSLAAGSAGSTSSGAELEGCAASQSTVAATMVALRKLTGITDVTLSSSTEPPGNAKTACKEPIQFQLALGFAVPKLPGAQGATASATGTAAADETGVAQ